MKDMKFYQQGQTKFKEQKEKISSIVSSQLTGGMLLVSFFLFQYYGIVINKKYVYEKELRCQEGEIHWLVH